MSAFSVMVPLSLTPYRSLQHQHPPIPLSLATTAPSLVPWSIIELNDEEITFAQLFQRIRAGSFGVIVVSNDVMRAQISYTFVGPKYLKCSYVNSKVQKFNNNLILNNN